MEETNFICICGKEFKSQKSLSAHQASCKEYYLSKYGNLDKWEQRKKKILVSLNRYKNSYEGKQKLQQQHILYLQKEQQKLSQWISEQHTCEKCGKVMTEKFASGRFCSRSCANSKPCSQEKKQHLSNKLQKFYSTHEQWNKILTEKMRKEYNNFPKKCCICNSIISYEHRNRKTCSFDCQMKRQSQICKQRNLGGYIQFSGSNKSSKGYYKGYYCDSTWELAFVIYNLENNIKFQRCEQVVEYKYQGKWHKYHPDFELADGTIIEIKGYRYDQDRLDEKIISANKKFGKDKFKVLYRDDVQPMIDYVKQKYNVSNLKELYD